MVTDKWGSSSLSPENIRHREKVAFLALSDMEGVFNKAMTRCSAKICSLFHLSFLDPFTDLFLKGYSWFSNHHKSFSSLTCSQAVATRSQFALFPSQSPAKLPATGLHSSATYISGPLVLHLFPVIQGSHFFVLAGWRNCVSMTSLNAC